MIEPSALPHVPLQDPSLLRQAKPRTSGITMVIDKGLGMNAFADLLQTASDYIDFLKIGFGTTSLYPANLLRKKVSMAREYGVAAYPGGTFLEVALAHNSLDHYFKTVKMMGFSTIEISDGTLSYSRELRGRLVERAIREDLQVISEYGKKKPGYSLDVDDFSRTVEEDIARGCCYVIVEGRESGRGVGVFDEAGECDQDLVRQMISHIANRHQLLWEAPNKDQQVFFINHLGRDVNLGNISPQDIYSLEALRRGLRSDTFVFPHQCEEEKLC